MTARLDSLGRLNAGRLPGVSVCHAIGSMLRCGDARLRRLALDYLRQIDRDLNPAALAAALGCSTRTVRRMTAQRRQT